MKSLFPAEINTAEGMIALGESFAKQLNSGEVVALVGDLGAGKTHFTKGLSKALGYSGEVTSPTFTLAQEYSSDEALLVHFDFYRMEYEEELLGIGWEDYLDSGAILVVEWANKFPQVIPAGSHCIDIRYTESGRLVGYHTVS